jgi:hypothetical protein
MKIILGPGMPGQNGGVVPPNRQDPSDNRSPVQSVDSNDPDSVALYKGIPIHLYGSVTVTPNSSAAVNGVALKNPNPGPMLINEIKFMISGASLALQSMSGGGLRCRLDMGKIPLSNGSIPLWLYGRVENLTQEGNSRFMTFKWKLPRPIFVPSGAAIIPTFYHAGIPGDTPVVASVAYGGRAFGPDFSPRKIYLPYVAGYTTKIFDIDESTADTSSETDLVNQFDTPLVVDRITGRIDSLTTNNTQDDYVANLYPAAVELVTLRMWDSLGNSIVRSYTPLYTVCHGVMRSWQLDGKVTLPPGAYYIADFLKNAPGYTTNSGNRLQAGIAINAWREVSR